MKRDTQPLEDIDLAAMIAVALHIKLRAAGVTVAVSHGAVTLEGEAESEQQRSGAEDIARRFCDDVTNAVRVRKRLSLRQP